MFSVPVPFCVLKLSWVERHPSKIKACKDVFSLVFMYWAYHNKGKKVLVNKNIWVQCNVK